MRRRRGSGGQYVQVKWLSHVDLDRKALAEMVAAQAAQMIVQRTRAGTGSKGQPLDTDLEETGAMLDSIKKRRVSIKPDRIVITVGPSRRKNPRPGSDLTNAQVARILHRGNKHIKARPFLALTPLQVRELARKIKKARKVLIAKRGPLDLRNVWLPSTKRAR